MNSIDAMRLWITVEDGDMFEGTLEQFQDCFFSNAEPALIMDWCHEQGWKCEIRNYNHFVSGSSTRGLDNG